ncbi:hypothetical protein CERZMDRAFT_121438 [Cercospora zeae-maydis SCOH1-5]|uniref:Uncharacterized protein n=1 Tax=Cercospora zeae-maydis SCOH1-5 TaxID=717836 RepID=A0A6A6FED8_9PEZI|nr:hypothetical protein CERZMDRAFT_121438 [Cercospora zeae-maydis SCOH1-5]
MGDVDPITSFLNAYHASGQVPSIPERQPAITCCCGDAACAYLRHNEQALSVLERDVRTAAQVGKALLTRHEAYIQDSEKERKAMAAHIQSLEEEKQALERQNANAIEDNRSLLDQLESLNNAVADSDIQVTNLQTTLRSTQQELQKLSYLQSRTESLEQQLADFEREQASWQVTFEQKDQAEKTALRRWQEAQRTLSHLQEQMEHIEREAREEKERHVEVLGRMERQHAVEKELDSAAGRLKGAAAIKTAGNGTNVVSHFVKDILQDNANLQMGIVELRDMLQNSNEEVETLRKQLSVHQPVVSAADLPEPTTSPIRPHLKEEMRRATSQELHVHHHYHAPNTPKAPIVRRPKKKRYVLERPRLLRRATSHESILSCRGMDIHTLKSRPSQLLTPYGSRSFTPQAVISDATAQVSASMSRPSGSGHRMLSGMTPPVAGRHSSSNKPGLGSRVGGWMFGKWGASPTPSVTVSDVNASVSPPKMNRSVSIASGSTGRSTEDADATPKKPKLRPPGINQLGPIPGFGPEIKISHPPIIKSLDKSALQKVLDEEAQ